MSNLPKEGETKREKVFKFGKGVLKFLWKVGVVLAGATAFTNPVSAVIAGTSAISSAVSALVKDKNYIPAMKIINLLACNMDSAQNDPKNNS